MLGAVKGIKRQGSFLGAHPASDFSPRFELSSFAFMYIMANTGNFRGGRAPAPFPIRLARRQACCQDENRPFSCRQKRILQFSPPLAYAGRAGTQQECRNSRPPTHQRLVIRRSESRRGKAATNRRTLQEFAPNYNFPLTDAQPKSRTGLFIETRAKTASCGRLARCLGSVPLPPRRGMAIVATPAHGRDALGAKISVPRYGPRGADRE
jgi:hypothetical protein